MLVLACLLKQIITPGWFMLVNLVLTSLNWLAYVAFRIFGLKKCLSLVTDIQN